MFKIPLAIFVATILLLSYAYGEWAAFTVTWDVPHRSACLALALVRPDGSAPDGIPIEIDSLRATVLADIAPADSYRVFLCDICDNVCTDTVSVVGAGLAGAELTLHFRRQPLDAPLRTTWWAIKELRP